MTKKQLVLKEINSNPGLARKALETLYYNRTYVIYTNLIDNVRIDTFYKTNRGAKGYIKRQGYISWYDDYTHEMVNAGSGLKIIEIQEHEIVDPATNKKMWYLYLKERWSKNWLLNSVLNEAKSIVTDLELLKWIKETIENIKETNNFLIIDELEEKEDFEETNEDKRLELIKLGVERIKEAGRINTNDFEDIIEQLKPYGMGFVDAQNTITATYIEQLEEKDPTKEDTKVLEIQENNNIDVEISFNEEKNGIEIKFDNKPPKEVLENLKVNGFRWSRYQKIWYAKDTEERRNFIKQFNNSTITEVEPKIFEYPEIDIDDLDSYKVDAGLSKQENESSWIFRSKERNHNEEIKNILEGYQLQAIEILNLAEDEETIYYIKRDLQRFKKAYHGNYIARLTNKANNPSWAVTGRSGRNARKDQRAMDRYDNLMKESIEIVEKFETQLNRYKRKIKKTARQEEFKEIENTDVEIIFKVVTKEIEYLKVKQKVRTYNYKDFMIAKLWGCYRIFKDGKEIKSFRTKDTLKTAKKVVQWLINKELQEIQEAI